MRAALLVLWVATLGADRIDLLAGVGPLLLTPTLLLTPVVVAFEATRLRRGSGAVYVPRRAPAYALLVTILLCVALLSVFRSPDLETSVNRLGLLIVYAYGTLLVALVLADPERDSGPVLVRGAYWGLALAFALNIAQLLVWLPAVNMPERVLGGAVSLDVRDYAAFVPRLSGQSLDQNRGGLLVLIYTYLLVRFAPPSRMRGLFLWAAVISMFATLSRSVLLACVGMGFVLLFRRDRYRISRARAIALTLAGSVVVIGVIAAPSLFDAALTALSPLGLRFSIAEGSASIHLELIREGLAVATSSLRNALLGVGFGSAYTLLENYFPGNKYGNFHSYYLTFWVESGIFALVLGTLAVIVPLVTRNAYRPLLGGILLFNLFYQAHTDGAFWFVLALAWLQVEPHRLGSTSSAGDGPGKVGETGALAPARERTGSAGALMTAGSRP